MPLFPVVFTDEDWFSTLLLTVMTRRPHTGTIFLKVNLRTNLHEGEYRSLAQYTSVNNIELTVETYQKNIYPINLLNPRVLYVIARTIPDNFSI